MAPLPRFWCTAVYAIVCVSLFAKGAEINSCSAVKNVYFRQGFRDEVPEYPISDSNLKLCKSKSGSTCCTPVMEHKLSVQSRQDFDVKLKKLLNPFANLLDKKHQKIDELFMNLLNSSQKNFDKIFRMTYGIIYHQNAYIFNDLFETFENYYLYGRLDLQAEMGRFFKTLYQKLFTVFNSQYIFSDEYLKCVDSHMEQLKPFGDDPQKLTTNVKRSFIALRTFAQGLSTGASVVRKILQANPSVNCLHELMKMSQCSTCAAHLGAKPCLPYCLHVQELCLAHHIPLANLWDQFTDAMQKLGDRLEGPFNIVHEVPPIDLKISNAIMNFQESGAEISNKVFHGCGQPHLGRVARSPQQPNSRVRDTSGELNLETLDFSARRRAPSTGEDHDDGGRKNDEALSKLIREVKTKVKNSNSFWSELPSQMCKEARHHGASNCWTGQKLGKYEGHSLLDTSSPVTPPGGALDAQMFRLKLITKKLKEAYKGKDVSWMDEDWLKSDSSDADLRPLELDVEPPQDDEGSGSGWGSDIRRGPPSRGGVQYPPDDEDGYVEAEEGSGDMSEGSGMTHILGGRPAPPPYNPYDPDSHHTHKKGPPFPPTRENPSSSPSERPMTLSWAVAVYLVPALFSFIGSIS